MVSVLEWHFDAFYKFLSKWNSVNFLKHLLLAKHVVSCTENACTFRHDAIYPWPMSGNRVRQSAIANECRLFSICCLRDFNLTYKRPLSTTWMKRYFSLSWLLHSLVTVMANGLHDIFLGQHYSIVQWMLQRCKVIKGN